MGGQQVRFHVILFNYQNKYLKARDDAPLFRQGWKLSPSWGLTVGGIKIVVLSARATPSGHVTPIPATPAVTTYMI